MQGCARCTEGETELCPLRQWGEPPARTACDCPASCASCRPDGRCAQCLGQTLLLDGSCVVACPRDTHYPAAGECLPYVEEPSCSVGIAGCVACIDDRCAVCGAGLFLADGWCVAQCPAPLSAPPGGSTGSAMPGQVRRGAAARLCLSQRRAHIGGVRRPASIGATPASAPPARRRSTPRRRMGWRGSVWRASRDCTATRARASRRAPPAPFRRKTPQGSAATRAYRHSRPSAHTALCRSLSWCPTATWRLPPTLVRRGCLPAGPRTLSTGPLRGAGV